MLTIRAVYILLQYIVFNAAATTLDALIMAYVE